MKVPSADSITAIGKVGRPHGVDGWMSVILDAAAVGMEPGDFIFIDRDGLPVPYAVDDWAYKNDSVLTLKLSDVTTVEEARRLTGSRVWVDMSDCGAYDISGERPEHLALAHYTITDATTGQQVGRIEGIDTSTANVLFEVTAPDGRSLLIPASEDLIAGIDDSGRVISMRLPDGLLDL